MPFADINQHRAFFLTGLTQQMLFTKPWIWADQQVAAMVKVLHLTNFAHLNLLDEDIVQLSQPSQLESDVGRP